MHMKFYKISKEILDLVELIATDAFYGNNVADLLLKCGRLATYMKDFERVEVEE